MFPRSEPSQFYHVISWGVATTPRIVPMKSRHSIILVLLLLLPASAFAEETLRCQNERGRLLISVNIGNHAGYTALLDAGIQVPIVSTTAAAALGLQADEKGELKTSIALSPTLRFDARAAIGDLAFLSEQLGRTVDALVPLQQAGLELTLDVAAGTVGYRPLGSALLGNKVGGISTLRLRDSAAPLVQVLLNGKFQREMELDLSFPGVASLSEDTVQTLGLFGKNPPVLLTRASDGRTTTQFRIEGIRLGQTDLESPICELDPVRDRLGLAALQHFRVTMNYEAGLVRWDALRSGPVPMQPLIGYGLVLDRMRAGQWTLGVADDSPAAEAGARPGVVLVGIDSARLRDTGHATVGRMLRAVEGSTLTFTLQQDGVTRDILLTARPLL